MNTQRTQSAPQEGRLDDLVVRLRNGCIQDKSGYRSVVDKNQTDALLTEAAEEIERLKQWISDLRYSNGEAMFSLISLRQCRGIEGEATELADFLIAQHNASLSREAQPKVPAPDATSGRSARSDS